ncbi:MAG: YqaA family protein [bacterium]
MIALTISVRKKALKFALICSVGSILGGMFGYLIGFGFWNWVGDFFFNYIPGFSEARFTQIKRLYGTYDFLIVFTAGFTFIPYKIFTISSGVFKINFWGFLLASAISRSARFFIISGLIWRFGASIKRTIEKYFDYLAIVFILLLVAGFILIKLFFR